MCVENRCLETRSGSMGMTQKMRTFASTISGGMGLPQILQELDSYLSAENDALSMLLRT